MSSTWFRFFSKVFSRLRPNQRLRVLPVKQSSRAGRRQHNRSCQFSVSVVGLKRIFRTGTRFLASKGLCVLSVGFNPISANLIKASARRIYFVPEGQHDRSLARSAWDSVHQENRPVGYGMIGSRCAPLRESDRTLWGGSFWVALCPSANIAREFEGPRCETNERLEAYPRLRRGIVAGGA
jgi:hypothetical protein